MKTTYVFGAGKLAVCFEAETELEACKEYVKHVESKGNESDWAFNLSYQKALKTVLSHENNS